jgi:hypothetical protein
MMGLAQNGRTVLHKLPQSHQHWFVLHWFDGTQVGASSSCCTAVRSTPVGWGEDGCDAVQASRDMPMMTANVDLIMFIAFVLLVKACHKHQIRSKPCVASSLPCRTGSDRGGAGRGERRARRRS